MKTFKPIYIIFWLCLLLASLLPARSGVAARPPSAPRPGAASLPAGGDEGWQHQLVAARGRTGFDNDLALDGQGRPHLIFVERPRPDQNRLMYAYWDGAQWRTQLAGEESAVTSPSLALDREGRPHIAYAAADGLVYTSWDGEEWHSKLLAPGVVAGVSLVLHESGRPYIAFGQGTEVKVGSWDGEQWWQETVDSGTGTAVSLAVGLGDFFEIAYAGSDGALKYAYRGGIEWHSTTVDGGIQIDAVSLVLDSGAHPHIGYIAVDGSSRALKYAYSNGSTWEISTVAGAGEGPASAQASIALDGFTEPHLIYPRRAGDELLLEHVHRQQGQWYSQTLDRAPAASELGAYHALAVDGEGGVHLTYFDGRYQDLRYAAWESAWVTHPVVPFPAAIGATSLHLRLGAPHISYYDFSSAEVKIASWSGDWELQPVAGTGGQVRQTSLASAFARLLLSYTDQGQLFYQTGSGQSWDSFLVEGNATVSDYSRVLLPQGAGGRVAVAYFDKGADRLKLALLDPLEIHTNTAGPPLNDEYSGYLSTAVLAGGKVSISYYDAIRGHLRLATWDPTTGAWSDELVSGAGAYTGILNALQVDGSSGEPVVAYYSAAADTIYYAYREGGLWHIEPAVSPAGSVTALFLELELASRTRPLITYTTYVDGDLRLAGKEGGSWTVETVVDGSPGLGGLAATLGDRLHLAYTDNALFYTSRAANLAVNTAALSPPTLYGRYNPTNPYPEAGRRTSALGPAGLPVSGAPLDDMLLFELLHPLFAASPGGRHYLALYLEHGAEMGRIGLADPQLLWDAYGTLQNFMPGLQALVQGEGDSVVVTQEMVDDALDIWQRLAAAAGPALAATIEDELAQTDNLQQFAGLTFAEWFDALGAVAPPAHHLYLPAVAR